MNTSSDNASTMSEYKLPVPGTVYSIPADTHADLDLQDDKERIFYRRNAYYSYFRGRH